MGLSGQVNVLFTHGTAEVYGSFFVFTAAPICTLFAIQKRKFPLRDEIPFLYIIASGGVSSIEDIEKLSEAGIPAVIFGKAIYEGKIQLKDLLRFT